MTTLHDPGYRGFASDNYAGAHPEVLEAIAAANGGHQIAYGEDVYTARLQQAMRGLFGEQAETFPVFNGTGSNVTALQSMLPRWGAVICSGNAHIHLDENGAPERVAGLKLLTVPVPDGKLTPALIDTEAWGWGDEHRAQPLAVSITQSTEVGTVYTPDEVRAIADHVHERGMTLHMDGARLANAAASLGVPVREFTTDAGVDVVGFGGTKNGMLYGECVVVLAPAASDGMVYLRKLDMQLASKMRFVSAQFLALLDDDLWLRSAGHANAMAARLRSAVEDIEGVTITQATEANAVFAIFPAFADGEHEIMLNVLDAGGNMARLYSRGSVTVDRQAPIMSDAPVVHGSATVGADLVCDLTGLSAQSPQLAYRWLRSAPDGTGASPIDGATKGSYSPAAADLGRKLLCGVTATDRGGTTDRTSSPTSGAFAQGAVVQSAPAPGPGATPASNGVPGATGSTATPPTPTSAVAAVAAAAASAAVASGPSVVTGAAVQGPTAPGASNCPAGTTIALSRSRPRPASRARGSILIEGTVRDAAGTPAAGVPVTLLSKVRRPGQERTDSAEESVSGPDGRFALRASAGPSRDFQVVSRPCGASSSPYRQMVRGAVSLRAVNPRVRNGETVRFKGRVPGGYYGRGIGLELQVLVGRKWTDVRSIKTDRRGSYRTSYRFRRTFVRYTYRFRVVTRGGSGWPFEPARSALAKVRVN